MEGHIDETAQTIDSKTKIEKGERVERERGRERDGSYFTSSQEQKPCVLAD